MCRRGTCDSELCSLHTRSCDSGARDQLDRLPCMDMPATADKDIPFAFALSAASYSPSR